MRAATFLAVFPCFRKAHKPASPRSFAAQWKKKRFRIGEEEEHRARFVVEVFDAVESLFELVGQRHHFEIHVGKPLEVSWLCNGVLSAVCVALNQGRGEWCVLARKPVSFENLVTKASASGSTEITYQHRGYQVDIILFGEVRGPKGSSQHREKVSDYVPSKSEKSLTVPQVRMAMCRAPSLRYCREPHREPPGSEIPHHNAIKRL